MAGRFAEGIRANEYDSKVMRLSVDCLPGLWLDRIVPACALSPMNCRRRRDNSRELPMQGGGSRRMTDRFLDDDGVEKRRFCMQGYARQVCHRKMHPSEWAWRCVHACTVHVYESW